MAMLFATIQRYAIGCLAALLLLTAIPAAAQLGSIPSAQAERLALAELSRQGVDEDELRQKLISKGINLDQLTAEEILALQPQIEAAVQELKVEQEARKRQLAENERAVQAEIAAEEVSTELVDAVEEGASVAEAKIEALSERQPNIPARERTNIYGHHLFQNGTLDVYRATDQATTPPTYVLNTGDGLAISIFGVSQTDFVLTIDEDGFVRPPGVSKIYLRGRTLEEARRLVRSRLANYFVFQEGQFSMSVDAARTVQVSIYGEVVRSGTFALSALNGPLNALVAAGGPTAKGSVRNIQLIRNGDRQVIDVYEFINNPGDLSTITLQDRDILRVPMVEKIVTIEGGVRRPMRYELAEGETLSDLINYAGGTTVGAALDASRITRLNAGTLRVIDTEQRSFSSFFPADQDIIEIPVVANPVQEFVSVVGAVVVDGRFGYRPNLTLGDLLSRTKLQPSARRDVAFLQRVNADGSRNLLRVNLENESTDLETVLQRGDVLTVLSAAKFVDQGTFSVTGAVRDGDLKLPYPQEGQLTLEEAILLAGGLTSNALSEAVIIRTPRENLSAREYLRVELSSAPEFVVEIDDQIVLYTQDRFEDFPAIQISGAVRSPTQVPFNNSLSIDDLLYIAGGIRYDAARNRIEVYRLNITGEEAKTLVETLSLNGDGRLSSAFELQPYDEIYVRSIAEFEPIQSVRLEGEVRFPGMYARLPGENRVSDFVARAGGLTSDAFAAGATLYREGNGIGFVILELNEILSDKSLPENIVLRPGDVIRVPKPQDLVTIYLSGTGAQRIETDSLKADGTIQVAYQGPHRADWYINQYAGGFDSKKAKKKSLTASSSAGGIRRTRSFLGLKSYPRVEPGSIIRTGLKKQKPVKPQRERSSWGSIAQATLAGVTSLVTVVLLLERT